MVVSPHCWGIFASAYSSHADNRDLDLPSCFCALQALSNAVASGGNATANALSQALAQAAGSGANTQAIANALAQVMPKA